MSMHGNDIRLLAHPLEYDRHERGQPTTGRCLCAAGVEYSSERTPAKGGLHAVRLQHYAHVQAAEGAKPPTLTRAQEELLLSWDEALMQLHPSGPPESEYWQITAKRLVELGLLESQPGWQQARRSQRGQALRPTWQGYRLRRLLMLRRETDPLRRRRLRGLLDPARLP